MSTVSPAAPPKLPSSVSNQSLILKESQGLTSPAPFSMPLLGGEEVDVTGKAITFARLLHAYRRRYLLATFVGLMLAVTVGAVVWTLMPDNYEVQSVLQFTTQASSGAWRGGATYDGFDAAGFRATQKQLITSDIVLSMALLENDEETGSPISKLPIFEGLRDKKSLLKSMISVYLPDPGDLLYIKLTGNRPVEQVKLLNAVVRCYLRYQEEQEFKLVALPLAKLKKELDDASLNYRTVSDKYYADLANDHDIRDIGVARKLTLLQGDMQRAENKLAQADSQIQDTRRQIMMAKYRLDDQENKQFSDLYLESYFKEFDQYNELKAAETMAKKHYGDMSARVKNPRNPQLQSAEQQVLEATKLLDELKKELKPAVMEKFLAGDSKSGLPLPLLERSLEQYEAEAERLQAVVGDLRDKYEVSNKAQTELNERLRQMDELNRKIVSMNQAKDDYDMRLKGIRENPRVVEISKPEIPTSGSGLYRVLFSGMSAVLCFMIGAGSIILVESLKHRVNNLDEITLPGPGMRLLGTIPNLGRIRGKNAETTSAVLAESIDTVRTMILQGKNRNLLHVILVTSAGESEGKTTVATHLAASLARAGRSTLLLDGDLRQPSIHLLFGIPQQAGFCEILRGETEIDDAIHPAQLDGLHLLQAGQCDHVALTMLVKEQGAELFNTLRSKFDYIVIDSGPVLGYADALQLGHYSDAAVLSVLRDVSRLPLVYEAREQLEAVGVPILGAVVGRVATALRTPVAA